MRARKIAILLAITAVSALTLFFIVLADTEALGAELNSSSFGCGDFRLPLGDNVVYDFMIPSGTQSLPAAGMHLMHKEGM